MYLRIAAVLSSLTLVAISARGELPTFPYKAYITAADVHVRSGPGRNYYPTQKLKMGQEVEVYRHDPGGWYAIRPPKESFSWVSSRLLEIGEDGLATVTGDRVAARVGSRSSDVRDVIQVRLDRGELVELLEGKTAAEGDTAERWLKINPPAGEFRWVFGKYVDPDFAVDGVRRTSGDAGPVVRRAAPAAAVSPPPAEATGAPAVREASPPAVQAAGHSASSAAPVAADPQQLAPQAPPAMRQVSPEEFQAEVQDLEMRLSMMVLEEPTAWHFGNLADRVERLQAEAATAIQRGRARLLAKKITRLADIKRRYDTVAAVQQRVDLARAPSADRSAPRAVPGTTAASDSRYDGLGRLKRVVSPKVGAPRYALVNDQGEVDCYVTPAPDINLRHYEGKRIGVTGVSGLMLEPRAKHVAAKHVTLLDDTRLR